MLSPFETKKLPAPPDAITFSGVEIRFEDFRICSRRRERCELLTDRLHQACFEAF